jgi:hypothetical protein
VLVFALVCVNIQCVAFCALDPCNDETTASSSIPDVPLCHQHHDAPGQKAPAPCSHQLVVKGHAPQTPVTPVFIATVMAMDVPTGSLGAVPALSRIERAAARAPSPSLHATLCVVLRI